MKLTTRRLSNFLKWSSQMAGKPTTFVMAWLFIIFWIITGAMFGFTESWLLILDTTATVNAALMVFIIQNTQNRENKALHIKIDELLLSLNETEKQLVGSELREEEELDALRKALHDTKKLNRD